MKAITIHQPWASLLAHGIKKHETRSWPCPDKYVYHLYKKNWKPIAIHAGVTTQGLKDLGVKPEHLQALGLPNYRKVQMPFGRIIGTGFITLCLRIDHQVDHYTQGKKHVFEVTEISGPQAGCSGGHLWITQEEERLGDFSRGRYVWRFRGVRALKKPILCRGYQRFWTVPDDVEKLINEQ